MSYNCHFMIAYTYEIKLISFVCNKNYSIFSFHSKFIVIEPPSILYDFASVRCLLSYQFYIKVEKSFLIRTIQLHSTLFKSLTCNMYIFANNILIPISRQNKARFLLGNVKILKLCLHHSSAASYFLTIQKAPQRKITYLLIKVNHIDDITLHSN